MNTTTVLAAGLELLLPVMNTVAWTLLLTGYALFAWTMSDEPRCIVWEVDE